MPEDLKNSTEYQHGAIARLGDTIKESANSHLKNAEPTPNEAPVKPDENAPAPKSDLGKRTLTATLLTAMLVASLIIGGWAFSGFAFICIFIALYEEMRAISTCHNPLWWPSFVGLVASVPLMMAVSSRLMLLLLAMLSCCVIGGIIRRNEPKLEDITMSLLPMVSLVMPGMCLFGMASSNFQHLQTYLLALVFVIAITDDTAAYFVGRAVGGPKLCPKISPKKTISGSIGGLIGAMAGAVITGILFRTFRPGMSFPPFWAELCVGLLGAMAGQMGDLFASLVKRHCKVKDFGNLLPGHGGMMDRLDSIVFVAVIVYSYKLLLERFLL